MRRPHGSSGHATDPMGQAGHVVDVTGERRGGGQDKQGGSSPVVARPTVSS